LNITVSITVLLAASITLIDPSVGLVTNQVGQIMLRLAGVEDVWSFTKGQTQTIYNFASAMFKALEKTSTTKLLPGQGDFHNMVKGVKQE